MNPSAIIEPIKQHLVDFSDYLFTSISSEVSLINKLSLHTRKGSGKQLRPAMVFLSAGMTGEINQRTYDAALITELLHTAAIIHDDVVDKSDTRRGIESVNAKWDDGTAILYGDYLLSLSFKIASEKKEYEFLDIISRVFTDMSKGELMQKERVRDINTREQAYFDIINYKTASLVSACCEIAAVSASTSNKVRQDMKKFGEYIGMAYQIHDDMFDYKAAAGSIGKPVHNDIQEKKMTLPLIYSFNKVINPRSEKVSALIKNGALAHHEIEEVIDFVKTSGGLDYATELSNHYIKDAHDILAKFPDSPYRDGLKNLSEYVINRSF
jgi:octaprenyl-diphosphate synthase